MKSYTEQEVQIIEQQYRVMKLVLADPNFNKLSMYLHGKVRKSLRLAQEVLI